jgi:hypothetical protein
MYILPYYEKGRKGAFCFLEEAQVEA